MPGKASSASHSSRRHTLDAFAHTVCDGDAAGDRGAAIMGPAAGEEEGPGWSSTAESGAGGGDRGESLKPRPLT